MSNGEFIVGSCIPRTPALERGARSGRETRAQTATLDSHLRALGVDPAALDVALVLPSNESVRTAVEAGAGVAALSSLVVAPAIRAGTLHAAPIAFGPRAFFGLRHKERYRTKAADALLELIGSRRP